MDQDGLKDHPGILWWMRRQRVPGCSRMGQGWPRMILRIILGFLGGCGMSKFQEAPGWPRMVLKIILGFCGGCGISKHQDAPGWPSLSSSYLAFAFGVNPLQAALATKDTKKFSLALKACRIL